MITAHTQRVQRVCHIIRPIRLKVGTWSENNSGDYTKLSIHLNMEKLNRKGYVSDETLYLSYLTTAYSYAIEVFVEQKIFDYHLLSCVTSGFFYFKVV